MKQRERLSKSAPVYELPTLKIPVGCETAFSSHLLPAFHPHKLIIRVRPTATFQGILGGPHIGTGAHDVLEGARQAGQITRITPLGLAAQRAPLGVSMSGDALAPAFMIPAARQDPLADVAIVDLSPEVDEKKMAEEMKGDPSVSWVAPVPARYLCVSSPLSTPSVPEQMWNLKKIRWDRLSQQQKSAAKVKVAVLDTGIDRNHPSLPAIEAYHYAHPDVAAASSERDIVGHGTHVAGTIAAKLGDKVSGICSCELHCWKIFVDEPDYIRVRNQFLYVVNPEMYLAALRECEMDGIDVINLSIGGTQPPNEVELGRFRALLDRGTIIIAAMGNDGQQGSPVTFPAAIDGVIAVGATDDGDTVAGFSNRGAHISVSAPGVGIWSTLPTYPGYIGFPAIQRDGRPVPDTARGFARETNFAAWDGTSMSTPHVTAASALLLAQAGRKSPAQVKADLKAQAIKIPAMKGNTFTPEYGAGRLDLLSLLGESKPVPAANARKTKSISRKPRNRRPKK